MAKRIAVLVRERQSEALRVSVGLTLDDHKLEVFLLDRALEATPENATNLEVLKDMEMAIYTNTRENADVPFLANGEIARRILDCDTILPY